MMFKANNEKFDFLPVIYILTYLIHKHKSKTCFNFCSFFMNIIKYLFSFTKVS